MPIDLLTNCAINDTCDKHVCQKYYKKSAKQTKRNLSLCFSECCVLISRKIVVDRGNLSNGSILGSGLVVKICN